jgi:hypothetical protein
MSTKIFKYPAFLVSLSAGLGLSYKITDPKYKMGIIGLLAQVTTDYIFHPLDLINVRTKYYYKQGLSTYTTTKHILLNTGIQGFFKGGTVTLMGSSMSGFIYYFLYTDIRDTVKRKVKDESKFYIAYSVASIISQLSVCLFYYPFELITTRIQTGQYAYRNFLDGIVQIYNQSERGRFVPNMYKGYLPSMCLNTANAFLVFFTFEVARDYVAKMRGVRNTDVSGLDYFSCTLLAGFVSSTTLNFLEVYTIQRQIHGDSISFKDFLKAQNYRTILTSGLLARNLYGIFYTVFLLEFVNLYGKIFDIKL